jgi:hypothetical protein
MSAWWLLLAVLAVLAAGAAIGRWHDRLEAERIRQNRLIVLEHRRRNPPPPMPRRDGETAGWNTTQPMKP